MRERFIGLAMTRKLAYYRNVLRGISAFAVSHPEWRFVTLGEDPTRTTRAALKHVEGVIVGVHTREWCKLLSQSGVNFVNIACLVPGLPIPRVGVNNQLIGQTAVRHFQERGLRSFGFVGHQHSLYSLEREAAFRAAVEAAGHALAVYHSSSPHWFDEADSVGLMNDSRFQRWLRALPRPTGILAPNDLWGIELTEVCRDVGLRVPEDIAVLGVDDDDLYCLISRPPLSSIAIPAQAIGERAAALMNRLIDQPERCPAHDVLLPPGDVVVRRSTDLVAHDDPDVVAAIRFIRENAHRPLRVSDVLREVPVSRRWIERRIVEAIGLTLGAEIRRAHLERAQRLLLDTTLPIAQIARHSGYTDLRQLEAAFRRELGATPSQYRRQAAPH
jgi:LacI family transcriptional regulator